jgi:hypothetical protein
MDMGFSAGFHSVLCHRDLFRLYMGDAWSESECLLADVQHFAVQLRDYSHFSTRNNRDERQANSSHKMPDVTAVENLRSPESPAQISRA